MSGRLYLPGPAEPPRLADSPGRATTTSAGEGMTAHDNFSTLTDALPKLAHPDGSPIRTLVVDDEPLLADLVAMGVRMYGWEVRTSQDGLDAVAQARTWAPDVLVLDWMLPGIDGVEVLHRIRQHYPEVPALFLTAKDTVEDRITGLVKGGDDYVTKPFAIEEVLLRLHRLVERSGAAAADSAQIVVGDLVLNVDSREVARGGDPIDLTATQFELLRYLMENAKVVLTRAQILDNVWHYDFAGQANIVELYISYLRKKIDAGREPMIHTVRGVGYVLRPTG